MVLVGAPLNRHGVEMVSFRAISGHELGDGLTWFEMGFEMVRDGLRWCTRLLHSERFVHSAFPVSMSSSPISTP